MNLPPPSHPTHPQTTSLANAHVSSAMGDDERRKIPSPLSHRMPTLAGLFGLVYEKQGASQKSSRTCGIYYRMSFLSRNIPINVEWIYPPNAPSARGYKIVNTWYMGAPGKKFIWFQWKLNWKLDRGKEIEVERPQSPPGEQMDLMYGNLLVYFESLM